MALPARAFDPFEIQVYDGTSDAPGEPSIEMHLNRHHDATQLTFEPAVGITRFWEIGGYLMFSDWRYEGVKLRSKFVTPEGTLGNFRLGVNFEVSLDKDGNTGGEIRPILAFENHRFIAVINPNIGFPGASAEPCAMLKVKTGPIAIGAEYYGSLPHENYLLGAIDLISVKHLELNVGVGGGDAWIAKMILGYAF